MEGQEEEKNCLDEEREEKEEKEEKEEREEKEEKDCLDEALDGAILLSLFAYLLLLPRILFGQFWQGE